MNGTQKFGVIGLAVMGENLALNVERNGFPIAVYNRTWARTEEFLRTRGAGKQVVGARTLPEFVAALERPRRILVMVQAGRAVDTVLEQLRPLLADGDIVIDGGNSLFTDTERRSEAAKAGPFRFFGMGVSGGEEGALNGPSLMPGGDEEAYKHLEPILTRIAARTDSGPCVTYVGRGSAGHFVKMVHNGIEYGDMQLIAEAYDLLRTLGGLSADEMRGVFDGWNRGELQSYLIEITSRIVDFQDPAGGGLLLDKILDSAGQKGTGKWTTVAALDLGVPIPTITAAVDARLLSARKGERTTAAARLGGLATEAPVDRKALVEDVGAALYASKICSYAQGLVMLREADKASNYGLRLGEIARIWKAGCIIRAVFLDRIKSAFDRNPSLPNLVLDEEFAQGMQARDAAWRRVVRLAAERGIPTPAMSASLGWYDGFRRERGPAYLIQAQRDYFGAHTFQRIDREGTFHQDWSGADSH